MAGPWYILVKEGYSYRVQLPASIKINLIFSIGSLRHDPNDPLSRQANAPPLPVKVTVDDEYKV
jgi:hypothetical protein